VRHRASAKFWLFRAELPEEVQRLADENYELLKADPRHPSLHFKKIGRMWSVRVGGGGRCGHRVVLDRSSQRV